MASYFGILGNEREKTSSRRRNADHAEKNWEMPDDVEWKKRLSCRRQPILKE